MMGFFTGYWSRKSMPRYEMITDGATWAIRDTYSRRRELVSLLNPHIKWAPDEGMYFKTCWGDKATVETIFNRLMA